MRNIAIFILYVTVVVGITTALYHVFQQDQVRLRKAQRLFLQEKYVEAEKILEEDFVETEGGNAKVYRLLGLCRMQRGDEQAALRAFEKYIERGDLETSDLATLLGLYRANGKWQKALRLSKSLLEEHPENRTLRFQYARTLTEAGEFNRATKQYRIILGEQKNGT